MIVPGAKGQQKNPRLETQQQQISIAKYPTDEARNGGWPRYTKKPHKQQKNKK